MGILIILKIFFFFHVQDINTVWREKKEQHIEISLLQDKVKNYQSREYQCEKGKSDILSILN